MYQRLAAARLDAGAAAAAAADAAPRKRYSTLVIGHLLHAHALRFYAALPPPPQRRRSRPPKNFRTAHAAVKVSQSKACTCDTSDSTVREMISSKIKPKSVSKNMT